MLANNISERIVTKINVERNDRRNLLLDDVAKLASECKSYNICGEPEVKCVERLNDKLRELSELREEASSLSSMIVDIINDELNKGPVTEKKTVSAKTKRPSSRAAAKKPNSSRRKFTEGQIKKLVEKTPWIKEQYNTTSPKNLAGLLGIGVSTLERIVSDEWMPGQKYAATHNIQYNHTPVIREGLLAHRQRERNAIKQTN